MMPGMLRKVRQLPFVIHPTLGILKRKLQRPSTLVRVCFYRQRSAGGSPCQQGVVHGQGHRCGDQ